MPSGQIALQDARREGDWARLAGIVDDLVFTDARDARLRGDDVTRAFHGMLDAAPSPSVPGHRPRHPAATEMLAGGVPTKVVTCWATARSL